MNELRANTQAITVKADEEWRDTREILRVDSIGHNSETVITVDRDGSFVTYSFSEVVAEFVEI